MEKQTEKTEKIDIRISWEAYVSNVMAVYDHLTPDGKRQVCKTLTAMAQQLDSVEGGEE